MAGYDIIDGKRVPGLEITEDHVLRGIHRGSISVVGCTLTVCGEHHGSLSVTGEGKVIIEGEHHGSTSVTGSSTLEVSGQSHGSTSISRGSMILVQPTGKLAGSMINDGQLFIRGVFGGAYSGNGERVLEGEGYIKQARVVDGVHYYEW